MECQQTDWPLHKILCKAIKSVPSRPDATHKLGILFPEDVKTPQLVWINCKRVTNPYPIGNDYTLESPDISHLMSTDPLIDDMLIQYNMPRVFELDHTLRLNYETGFSRMGQRRTEVLRRPPQGPYVMIGVGLVALRQQVIEQDGSIVYEDITVADLRHTVD